MTRSEREDYSQYRDQLREAKKTDDGYTFPQQRDLRPKHSPGYLHISTHPTRGSAHGYNSESTLISPPSSPRSSSDASSLSNQYLTRGKRVGPLKNGDEVAEVRAVGACVCCRVRKVKVRLFAHLSYSNTQRLTCCQCDEKEVCGKCTDKAPKYKCGSGSISGRQICFRNPFAESQLLFPQIASTSRLLSSLVQKHPSLQ